jgi:hypothetical protein
MPFLPKNDFEPLSVTSWRMHVDYWVLTHFSQVRRWLIIVLGAISVLLYGWTAWQAIPIIRDPNLVSRIATQVENMKPFIPTPPQPLDISEVSTATHQRGTDLLATITNPNDNRLADKVRYSFILADGTATPEQSLWLQPQETRYAADYSLGQDNGEDAQLRITHLQWRRVYENQPVPILGIKATNVSLEIGASGQPTRAIFNLQNDDRVGYKLVQVIAVIRNSGQLIAVGTLEVNDLTSGETRSSTLTWYDPVPTGSQVEIQVLSNPFDRANVLLPA